MTTKTTTKPELAPDQLARVAQALERLLPPGMSIIHTRGRWYCKRWDSWVRVDKTPRMGWRDVDSDTSLPALLERLGEQA